MSVIFAEYRPVFKLNNLILRLNFKTISAPLSERKNGRQNRINGIGRQGRHYDVARWGDAMGPSNTNVSPMIGFNALSPCP